MLGSPLIQHSQNAIHVTYASLTFLRENLKIGKQVYTIERNLLFVH